MVSHYGVVQEERRESVAHRGKVVVGNGIFAWWSGFERVACARVFKYLAGISLPPIYLSQKVLMLFEVSVLCPAEPLFAAFGPGGAVFRRSMVGLVGGVGNRFCSVQRLFVPESCLCFFSSNPSRASNQTLFASLHFTSLLRFRAETAQAVPREGKNDIVDESSALFGSKDAAQKGPRGFLFANVRVKVRVAL